MARSQGGCGNWFVKFKLAKMIAVTSSLLIAYKTGGRDRRLLLLADKFPSDASIASVVQVFEFHLPLNFAYQGAIRLASSREPGELGQKHRQEAYDQLTLDLLPAMVVAFKLLGSHEYAKLVMTYIVMLDYWVKKRPDLIQIFMTNLGATLNEEPIENVHAHVSQNFSSVTMGTADYVQAQMSFLYRGPMRLLRTIFSSLKTGLHPDTPHTQRRVIAEKALAQDTTAAASALDSLFDALQEEAEQDSDSKMRQSQTHQQGLWYSRVLGPLTQMMTSTTNMKFMLADIEKKARKDLTQTTNHEFINQFTQNASNQYYTPGTGWEYAPFNMCEKHLKGDNFVLNKDFNSGLGTRVQRDASSQSRKESRRNAPRNSQHVHVDLSADFATLLDKMAAVLHLGSLHETEAIDSITSCHGVQYGPDSDDEEDDTEDVASHVHSIISGEYLLVEYNREPVSVVVLDRQGIVTATVGVDVETTSLLTEQSIISKLKGRKCGFLRRNGEEHVIRTSPEDSYRLDIARCVVLCHASVKNEIAQEFKHAVTALRSGHILISLGMCASVLRTRPTHARDLHIAYTNQAFAMVLRAVSLSLLAVRKFSNSQQSQRDLLREAGSILEEVLNGRQEMTLDAQISSLGWTTVVGPV